jgi:hypothetical protein
MRKKLILSCFLVTVVVMAAIPAVFAHTHIDLPNGDCVNIPEPAYNDGPSQAGNSHDGIGKAKDAGAPPLEGGLCP